jgi:hypothetical protein
VTAMSYTPPPPGTPIPIIEVTEQQRAAARRAIEAGEVWEFVTGQASFGLEDDLEDGLEDDDPNWKPPF